MNTKNELLENSKVGSIRNKRGLTRQQLSQMSGVYHGTIQMIEIKGDEQIKVAKLETLIALCKALNCRLRDLVPDEYKKLI